MKNHEQILQKLDELKTLIQSEKEIEEIPIENVKDYIDSLRRKIILTDKRETKILGVFSTPKEASDQSGYSKSTVYRCLNNPSHLTQEGLKFKYQ